MSKKSPNDSDAKVEAGPDKAEPFDELLDRLRKTVDRLEGGNLSLEDSLKAFEEGMQLCRKGGGVLDAAEKRVETLLSRPGASDQVVPFDADQENNNRE